MAIFFDINAKNKNSIVWGISMLFEINFNLYILIIIVKEIISHLCLQEVDLYKNMMNIYNF